MNWLDLVLWTVLAFALKHVVLIAIPVVIVLAIFFPSEAIALVRSRVGQIVVAVLVAIAIGWEARGFVEGAEEIRAQLAAERDKVKAAEQATATARALAADARRQALAQRAVAIAAASRSTQAQAEADAANEAVAGYEDRLEAAESRAAKGTKRRFALTPADVADLARFAAPRKR